MKPNKRTTETIARIKDLKEQAGCCPKCGRQYIKRYKDDTFNIVWYVHDENVKTPFGITVEKCQYNKRR